MYKLTTNYYETERAGLFNIFHDLPLQLLPIEKGDQIV